MFSIRQETYDLGKDLIVNNKNWESKEHYYTNGSLNLWTCNGVLAIDFYPNIGAFNIVEKFYIRRKIKQSILLKSLRNGNNKQ